MILINFLLLTREKESKESNILPPTPYAGLGNGSPYNYPYRKQYFDPLLKDKWSIFLVNFLKISQFILLNFFGK